MEHPRRNHTFSVIHWTVQIIWAFFSHRMTVPLAEFLSGLQSLTEAFLWLFLAFCFTPYPCNRSRELSGRAVQDIDIEEMRVRHHDLSHFDSLLRLTPSLIPGQLSPDVSIKAWPHNTGFYHTVCLSLSHQQIHEMRALQRSQ